VRCSLSKFSIRSVLSASAVHVRAMSAHAILIGMERASRAMRSHSVELDRHSAAESMGRAVCSIGCKVHSFSTLPYRNRFSNKASLSDSLCGQAALAAQTNGGLVFGRVWRGGLEQRPLRRHPHRAGKGYDAVDVVFLISVAFFVRSRGCAVFSIGYPPATLISTFWLSAR
jgi:hypothetical protein